MAETPISMDGKPRKRKDLLTKPQADIRIVQDPPQSLLQALLVALGFLHLHFQLLAPVRNLLLEWVNKQTHSTWGAKCTDTRKAAKQDVVGKLKP